MSVPWKRSVAGEHRDLSTSLCSGREDNPVVQPLSRGRVLKALLAVYKYTLSPFLHTAGGPSAGCRFQPTCSEYAVLAWHVHGPVRGSWLAAWRLLRCHPFARGGFDPVPGREVASAKKTPAI